MYGDPDVLRRHVHHLREQAVDVRALADRLVAQTESIGWTGRAAESMRIRVSERATRVESQLLKQYTALDSKMAQMNGLSSYVTAQLAQWNKSSR